MGFSVRSGPSSPLLACLPVVWVVSHSRSDFCLSSTPLQMWYKCVLAIILYLNLSSSFPACYTHTYIHTRARKETINVKKKSYVDPSVKQREIICLWRTAQTTSKQALLPLMHYLWKTGQGGGGGGRVVYERQLCVQYCLWCDVLCLLFMTSAASLSYCISKYKT